MTGKENFIKQFNEAFAKNDAAFILEHMSEKIIWDFAGHQLMEGKEAVKKALEEMNGVDTIEMSIIKIVTHGRSAAAHGTMTIKEATGEIKKYRFCDFYDFTNLKTYKIGKMTSYVVAINETNTIQDEKAEETKDRTLPVV